MFVGWTTRSMFCLVCSVIDYKTQRLIVLVIDGVDLLEIGPVNACQMAFKLDEATCMWKTFKIRLCWYRTRKEGRKVLKFAERRKNPLSSRSNPQSACAVTSGYPDAPSTRVQRAPGHPDDPPLKSFSNSSG